MALNKYDNKTFLMTLERLFSSDFINLIHFGFNETYSKTTYHINLIHNFPKLLFAAHFRKSQKKTINLSTQ